jgi:hypothetical protein
MIRIAHDSGGARRTAGLLGVGAVGLGLLLLTPAPAWADDADLGVDIVRSLTLTGPGDRGSLVFDVANNGPNDADLDVFVPPPLAAQGVEIVDVSDLCFVEDEIICEIDGLEAGEDLRIVATFEAPDELPRAVSQRSAVIVENFGGNELDTSDNFLQYTARLGSVPEVEATEPPPSPPPAPKPPPGPAELSGSVVDRGTNAPLAGAQVHLVDAKGGRSQVRAAAGGAFVWRPANGALRSGNVTITASMPGYRPAVITVNAAPNGKVDKLRLILAKVTPSAKPTSAGSGSGGGSDAEQRKRGAQRFDLVSRVIAGGIGLAALIGIAATAVMWHRLGPGARRQAVGLLPASHRRRWFDRTRARAR